MRRDDHPGHDNLIDFVEADLPPEEIRKIEIHLEGCEACRAYVRTLRQTFSALEGDRVPEPPEAFFTFLAGRAKARAGRGRRLLWRFIPGLASAAATIVLMWWLAGSSFLPVDGIDIIMADMTTGEIVEAVSADPGAESVFVEDSGGSLSEIEIYLLETESIYDLLDGMSDTEKERFTAYLEGAMTGEGGTSGLMIGCMRKGC
jgi:hypothetical protein